MLTSVASELLARDIEGLLPSGICLSGCLLFNLQEHDDGPFKWNFGSKITSKSHDQFHRSSAFIFLGIPVAVGSWGLSLVVQPQYLLRRGKTNGHLYLWLSRYKLMSTCNLQGGHVLHVIVGNINY
jgi:hypothetical protein